MEGEVRGGGGASAAGAAARAAGGVHLQPADSGASANVYAAMPLREQLRGCI